MPQFSVRSTTDDSAIDASSVDGEAIHAETTSAGVAAIAAYQLSQAGGATGAAVYALASSEGPAIVALQQHIATRAAAVYAEVAGNGSAIACVQNNPNSAAAALYAKHVTAGPAGYFHGDVIVTGDLSFPGMDCAEEFEIDDIATAEPGTLMSLGDDGALVPSRAEYERRVVGIVAGAGEFRPGIVLGRDPQRADGGRRRPIALVGRAYCKAVVTDQAIEVGDLLTSSAVPGHAMRAGDPARAFGAVIGKAMAPLRNGAGLVPVLISLQ